MIFAKPPSMLLLWGAARLPPYRRDLFNQTNAKKECGDKSNSLKSAVCNKKKLMHFQIVISEVCITKALQVLGAATSAREHVTFFNAF